MMLIRIARVKIALLQSALETRLQSSIGGEIDGFSVSMLCENYCRKNGFPGFALHTRDVICFQVLNSVRSPLMRIFVLQVR